MLVREGARASSFAAEDDSLLPCFAASRAEMGGGRTDSRSSAIREDVYRC